MTEAELLAEVERAMNERPAGPDDAYTSAEFAEVLGCHVDTAKIRLRVLAKAGRLQLVKVKRQSPLADYATTVTAYRILPPS